MSLTLRRLEALLKMLPRVALTLPRGSQAERHPQQRRICRSSLARPVLVLALP